MIGDFRGNTAPPPVEVLRLPVNNHQPGPQAGAENPQQEGTAEDVLHLLKPMVLHFYNAIIESTLTSSITNRYVAATAKYKGRAECSISFALLVG